jgi:hypothetical protein
MPVTNEIAATRPPTTRTAGESRRKKLARAGAASGAGGTGSATGATADSPGVTVRGVRGFLGVGVLLSAPAFRDDFEDPPLIA